jgi:hypothetical protein
MSRFVDTNERLRVRLRVGRGAASRASGKRIFQSKVTNLRVSRCRNNQACDPRVLHCLVEGEKL